MHQFKTTRRAMLAGTLLGGAGLAAGSPALAQAARATGRAEAVEEARRLKAAERKSARTGRPVHEILGKPEPAPVAVVEQVKRAQPKRQPKSKRRPGAA